LSKVQAFLCFQIIHAVRSVAEARPLRMGFGVASLAVSHHSLSVGSPSGGRHISRSQDSVSCHTCLEKGHVMSRWCIVSGSWSHRVHRGLCWRPRRCKRSAVQHLFLLASHRKNLTRGGAQLFQINFQALQVVDPWKEAR
jgi:hypothetical protein